MKIGVVGGGVVGRATARCWLEHVEAVHVYDVLPERSTSGMLDILLCDLIFVCLPEAAVEEFFAALAGSPANFVLKSTVPIGTTRRLAEKYRLQNLVHSPEFLTARCAMTDVQMPARNIMGIVQKDFGGNCPDMLVELYERRFPGVPVYLMSSEESEAVKLFTNGFFAVKIAYFNEIRALADRLNLDWDAIRVGMLSDGRIAHSHTQVPGPDGKFGFGGGCLPKDLEMLIDQIEENNPNDHHSLHSSVTRAVCHRNNHIDRIRDA